MVEKTASPRPILGGEAPERLSADRIIPKRLQSSDETERAALRERLKNWVPGPETVYAVTEPEFVGRLPVRTELTVLPADPDRKPIGWMVNCYEGTEVYKLDAPDVPLTKRKDIRPGDKILVSTCVGTYEMTVFKRGRKLWAESQGVGPGVDPSMSIPKYPSIVLVARRPEIFAVKEVVAYEKLHGSTFRVHFPMGMTSIDEVKYGSHDTEEGEEGFSLGRAVQWWKSKPALLETIWEVVKSYNYSDFTIHGEAYGPGVLAKGVKYTDGQDILFRAFDFMCGSNLFTTALFEEMADKMGLPIVHEVYRGPPSIEAFDALLEKPSVEAIKNGMAKPDNAEGVVIRSNPLLRDTFGEYLIVKHKGKKFTEVAHAPSAPKERVATPADAFAATFVTEGRIMNAQGRLADRGTPLKGQMADMPVLLTEIIADLHKECESEWREAGMPDIAMKSSISKVLGPLYRKMITEGT